MQKGHGSMPRSSYVAMLVLMSLASAPAHAHGNGGAALEFLRIFLEVVARAPLQGPPPPAAPVPVPVRTPAPAPEVVFTPNPEVRLKGQDVGFLPPGRGVDFEVRDFGRSFYTLVGGSASDATGLVQQDGLPDPALTVGDDLAQAVSRHYDAHYVGLESAYVPDAAAPGAPLGSGFTTEVTTTYWEMKAVSINPIHIGYGLHHYGVYYHAKFKLIDRRDGSILASGKCDEAPPTWGAPTYDEALADGGKRLKDMMQAVGHQCALDIENDYLSIRMPAV